MLVSHQKLVTLWQACCDTCGRLEEADIDGVPFACQQDATSHCLERGWRFGGVDRCRFICDDCYASFQDEGPRLFPAKKPVARQK